MEQSFKIVTCGDSNYFKFLEKFECNIYKFYGEYPIIYDLGLESHQKQKLKSKILKYSSKIEGFESYSDQGFIKASHKPYIVLDLLQKGVDVILLDADMLLTKKLSITDFNFDIGITPRHPEERYPKLYENGYINSGTLFFKSNDKTISIVENWIELCKKDNFSDQLALSEILLKYMSVEDIFNEEYIFSSDVVFKNFIPEIYNDVTLSNGKILHYKNAGRFEKAFSRYKFDYYLIKYNVPYRSLIGKIYNKL